VDLLEGEPTAPEDGPPLPARLKPPVAEASQSFSGGRGSHPVCPGSEGRFIR